jgi:antitoxin component YwqK of YwqJK toxin-antitoxin module
MMVACKSEKNTEDVIQHYDTGEVSRKYSLVDGKKEGAMIDYYKDGSVKGERMFANDIQIGKTTLYHPNGTIKEVQYYDEGKLHGGDTVFYPSGQPEMVIQFDHGLKHGYVRKWSERDSLIYEARFERDTVVEVKGQSLRKDSLEIH